MTDTSGADRTAAPDGMPCRQGLIDPALLDHLRKTVAAVTRPWWRGEVVSENELIYGVNLAGSRPPLLWCFQGYAEFSALAAALGPDQPLYGMRSGHLVVETSARNHLHMAIVFAQEVQSLGLSGPLCLGGNCQGAMQAQKIAQILTASGQAITLLIGLNPFLFMPYAGRTALIFGRHDTTNPLHRFHDAETCLRANLPNCTIDTLPSEHGKLFGGRILGLWSAVVRRRMDEAAGTFPGSFPIWSLSAGITVPAQLAMTAGRLYDVPVTLRNTTETVWRPGCESGLSVGNHWRRADGRLVQWLDGQRSLDRPLPPGASADMGLLVRAPDEEGEYLLEVDVQQAGVMWLSELGKKPATCRVDISPADNRAPSAG